MRKLTCTVLDSLGSSIVVHAVQQPNEALQCINKAVHVIQLVSRNKDHRSCKEAVTRIQTHYQIMQEKYHDWHS